MGRAGAAGGRRAAGAMGGAIAGLHGPAADAINAGSAVLPVTSLAIIALCASALAVCSALFSALETALFALDPVRLDRLRRTNSAVAGDFANLLRNPRRLLGAILLADVLTNVPLILCCLLLLREVRPDLFPFWAKALTLFAVVVMAGDLGPKCLALLAPERVGALGLPVLKFVLPLADPISRVLQAWSERAADRLTPARLAPHRFLGEEEMEALVQIGTEEGALQGSEGEMIREIIKLGDKTAKDCMTPRTEMFALPDDLPAEEVVRRLREKRFRRVPVRGDTPDEILGILDVRDLLLNPGERYTERLVPPSYVPETMKALDLLRGFLSHPQRMAVVVDEFGGTEGIVTLADIIEDIIGDAVPAGGRELAVEVLGDGRLLASGATRLDDLVEYGFAAAEEGVDTIGGLVFNRLGYLPQPGAELVVANHVVRVRRVVRQRITEVLIAGLPAAGAAGGGAGDGENREARA